MTGELAKRVRDGQLLRSPFIGFDDFFDSFNSFFDTRFDFMTFPKLAKNNFPPYDLLETDKGYSLEVAVAGYDKKDISITNDNGNLVIEANKASEDAEVSEESYLYKGIAKRQFKLSYKLSEDIKIDGAEMKDGLLKVTMTKLVPDVKGLEQIEIK